MIATARLAPVPTLRPLVRVVGLVVGLFAVVGARWAATRAGLDPLLVGVVFGLALLGLALLGLAAGGRCLPRLGRSDERSARRLVALLGIGALAGLGLVGLALLGPAIATAPSVAGPRPAGRAVRALGARHRRSLRSPRRLLLRGVLFDRDPSTRAAPRPRSSSRASSFALLHVPLYGWHVVPLDLGVGLALGGLRLVDRRVARPRRPRVADLATWWL